MTSQGSPYTRFKRALDTGNLHLVRAAAVELPRVELGDALKIVFLMRDDDALYERASVRWLGRFCLEAPDVGLDDVQEAAQGLTGVAIGFSGALDRLADLCRDCGITRV